MTGSNSWWEIAKNGLEQGDLLPDCLIPIFPENLDEIYRNQLSNKPPIPQLVKPADLIVVTQTCDLGNDKAKSVALARYITLTEYQDRKNYKNAKDVLSDKNNIRKGRIEGFLMLPPPNPLLNQEFLIVSFREIFSLPYDYLVRHSGNIKNRVTLKNPYKEYFSQAFGNYYMRIALPAPIEEFK